MTEPAVSPRLTLDTEHVYRLGDLPLPGVTDVLTEAGILPDFAGLDPFYAQRGHAFHEGIRLKLLDQLDEDTVSPAIRVYLDRALEFLRLMELAPVVVEKPFYSRSYLYAGKPDLLAMDSRKRLWLIDWKTGAWHRGHGVQLAAYHMLLCEAADYGEIPVATTAVYGAHRRVVSLLSEPAKMTPLAPDPNLRAVFLGALAVHNWRRGSG